MVTALISFFRDRRSSQAGAGRRALARFGPELTVPAVPVLLDVLKETVGNDGPLAPTVCAAIGRAAPATPWADRAVEALSAALDAKWGFTRSEAASALARIGPRRGPHCPASVLSKSDPEPAVRTAASLAASRIEGADDPGTPESVGVGGASGAASLKSPAKLGRDHFAPSDSAVIRFDGRRGVGGGPSPLRSLSASSMPKTAS